MLNVPERDLRRTTEVLKSGGFIVAAGRHSNQFLPARSLSSTRLFDVVRVILGTQETGLTGRDAQRTAVRLFLEITGAAESAVSEYSVADYLERAEGAAIGGVESRGITSN